MQQPAAKSSVWHGLRFSTDSQTDKFRKLMGIREPSATAPGAEASGLQRQQDALFRDLDRQYTTARSVTHTARGSGLGFGSR